MGHSSTRAARVYLHAREERDRQLASTLDKMARRELRRSSGAQKAGQSDATGMAARQSAAAVRQKRVIMPVSWAVMVRERVTGIEPALSAWEVCGAVGLRPADS